jgi:hypothetical protein
MAAAQQWLTRTWDTALAAYAAEVSRQHRQPTAENDGVTREHWTG